MFIFLAVTLMLSAFLAVSTGEGIAIAIAGVLAPILAQFMKGLTGASGLWALLVAIVASGVVAIVAMFIAGEARTIGDFIQNISAVFGIATVVYKLIAAANAE